VTRELENIVERAAILSRSGILRVDLDELLRAHEREAIESALHNSSGRVSGPGGAAERLGIPASTPESRIKRLGIDKFGYRSRVGKIQVVALG